MTGKKIIRPVALFMAGLIAVALTPFFGSSVANAANDDGKKIYDQYMSTKLPAHYEDEGYEPYGYGVDVPFFLNKQSELLFYQTYRDSSGDINTFYDKLNSASTDDVLKGTKTNAVKAPPTKLKQAYFVQAIAFDPNGTARDDHIAFIGVYYDSDAEHVYAYLWAYDTVNRKWSSEFNLGTYENAYCDWMEKTHITDYEAVNFLSITAGDYDGDGKDTVVAFASFDGDDGYSLYEVKCENLKLGYYEPDEPEGWSLRHDKYKSSLAEQNTTETRMGCELDTGDIDGDGLDDLVVLTYIGNLDDNDLDYQTYWPEVKVSHGVKGGKGLINHPTDHTVQSVYTANWHEGDWWNNQLSPSMSVGDIDHDGKDEIVTAGARCRTKRKTNQAWTVTCHEMHKTEMFISVIDDSGNRVYTSVQDMNAWTAKGFYPNEDIWSKLAVQCVAINGVGNPELIFISGTLYKYDKNNNTMTAAYTPDYFKNAGDNLGNKISTNMFVQSTAAGNFDANDQGFEQVAFTVSLKTDSKRSYDYVRGVIGGKKFNSTTGIAAEYYATAKDKMDDEAKDDNSWPGNNEHNASGYISEHKGLNCIVVAADCDKDGVMARYKDKSLIYADPEVMCILQAPPYFKDVKDYLTDASSTNYDITNIQNYETTESDSVSYGIGVVAGLETPALQMELTAGYALDWSKEFTKGLSTAVNFGWHAKEKDYVVVMRKPVVYYHYELQEPDGSWGVRTADVLVPCEPSFKGMGVDVYNQFATYYNNTMSKYLKDFHKLDLLKNEWLGHEGDPQKYIKWTNSKFKTDSGYKIIQTTELELGHTSESVTWGKITGESVGVTESMSHGFTYDATIAMGPNVGGASAYLGLSTSLQYMSGYSTTRTQTQEQGISCEINALKADMPKELNGLDYNFSFKMARWPSGVKRYVNGKAEDVPVYGYALSGVTVPEEKIGVSVEDQKKASKVSEDMCELPSLEGVSLEDEAAIKAVKDEYDALSDPAKTLVDANELLALISRIELLKNGGLDLSGAKVRFDKATLTYNGKVQKPSILTVNGYMLQEGLDYTAEWSNKSSKNVGAYSVTLTGIGICSGTVTAKYAIAKAANPLSVKAKAATVKFAKLKKKAQPLAVSKVIKFAKKGEGKMSYKLAGATPGKFKKFFKVDKKTGKVTVKKGLKKGTYRVKVKVQAAGNANYKASAWKTVTFKVKVK